MQLSHPEPGEEIQTSFPEYQDSLLQQEEEDSRAELHGGLEFPENRNLTQNYEATVLKETYVELEKMRGTVALPGDGVRNTHYLRSSAAGVGVYLKLCITITTITITLNIRITSTFFTSIFSTIISIPMTIALILIFIADQLCISVQHQVRHELVHFLEGDPSEGSIRLVVSMFTNGAGSSCEGVGECVRRQNPEP